MKNTLKLLILTIVLVSCGQNAQQSVDAIIADGNPKLLESKREELKTKQKEIDTDLKRIDDELSKNNSNEKLPLISTFIVQESVFDHFLNVQGNVVTKQNIVIYPEYNGTLTHVFVKEGQKVTKGQQLAKIDDGGLSQQLAQLEAQASLAKTTFERQKRLWEQKIGSEIQYLQAETNYTAQRNAVEQLKVQLAKTTVRAPFSGIIDNVITEQGTVILAGQSQLMRIVNLSNMYIEAEVPESHLINIKKGKKVEVFFPVLGKTVDTEIRQVGNYINPNNRSFKIEIGVPNKNGDIKPNLTSRLRINDYTNPKALLIPQSIISENSEGKQYIYVIADKKDDNKAQVKRVFVKTGQTQGDVIEILDGVKNGDEIINEGARNVKEGQTVKVLNK